jgi:hypothetical protein
MSEIGNIFVSKDEGRAFAEDFGRLFSREQIENDNLFVGPHTEEQGELLFRYAFRCLLVEGMGGIENARFLMERTGGTTPEEATALALAAKAEGQDVVTNADFQAAMQQAQTSKVIEITL